MRSKPSSVPTPPKTALRTRLALWFFPLVAISLFLAYKELQSLVVHPQAAFVLGGSETRESFAAKLAQKDPNLQIWVSSGSPKDYALKIFKKARVSLDRVHLDYQAKDTVTNFTTLVDDLQAAGIDSVYLITSDQHMKRARLVGEIVFGSRGITIKPLAVPSNLETEPAEKVVRDGARAFLWLITGYTGADWKFATWLTRGTDTNPWRSK